MTDIEKFRINRGESISDFVKAHPEIKVGDLLYFHRVGYENEANHATIISKITDSEICYAGHSDPQYEKALSEAIMDKDGNGNFLYENVYIIRMSDVFD